MMGGDRESGSKHVVIVMDGMQEMSMEVLTWALENILTPAFNLTILVHLPWTSSPSPHTHASLWTMGFEDLADDQQRSDTHYQQLQSAYTLCQKYNIVPQKKVIMGYPRRLVLVDELARLNAMMAVFDRHYNKHREYLVRNVGCNMVMMNEDGSVDAFLKHEPTMEQE